MRDTPVPDGSTFPICLVASNATRILPQTPGTSHSLFFLGGDRNWHTKLGVAGGPTLLSMTEFLSRNQVTFQTQSIEKLDALPIFLRLR